VVQEFRNEKSYGDITANVSFTMQKIIEGKVDKQTMTKTWLQNVGCFNSIHGVMEEV